MSSAFGRHGAQFTEQILYVFPVLEIADNGCEVTIHILRIVNKI